MHVHSPACNIMATLDPAAGHSTRQSLAWPSSDHPRASRRPALPDGMAFLLRPVSLLEPDTGCAHPPRLPLALLSRLGRMIAEAVLTAKGFTTARALAKKLVQFGGTLAQNGAASVCASTRRTCDASTLTGWSWSRAQSGTEWNLRLVLAVVQAAHHARVTEQVEDEVRCSQPCLDVPFAIAPRRTKPSRAGWPRSRCRGSTRSRAASCRQEQGGAQARSDSSAAAVVRVVRRRGRGGRCGPAGWHEERALAVQRG